MPGSWSLIPLRSDAARRSARDEETRTKIFISYRREETAGEARALFNTLVARLGESSVFMDVDSVALGRDFRQVLQESLASCDLVLVIIGRDWLDAKSGSGQRRIEDPEDFVHLEIGVALKRNIPITPVLVQRAEMPTAQHLPQGIKDFAYRNGFELSHNRWESDVQELLKRLGVGKQPVPEARTETDPPAVRTPGGRTSRQWLVIGGTLIVLVGSLGAGLRYYTSSSDDEKPPAANGARIDFDPPARSGSGVVTDAGAARRVPEAVRLHPDPAGTSSGRRHCHRYDRVEPGALSEMSRTRRAYPGRSSA